MRGAWAVQFASVYPIELVTIHQTMQFHIPGNRHLGFVSLRLDLVAGSREGLQTDKQKVNFSYFEIPEIRVY
jgi:hypothetical protein